MVKGSRNRFEVRLGPTQATALVGIALGCIISAYYLGFQSGRSTGYETAFLSNVAASAKVPIKGSQDLEERSTDGEERQLLSMSDVYARLEKSEPAPSAENDEETPPLQPIREVDRERDAELIGALNREQENLSASLDDVWARDANEEATEAAPGEKPADTSSLAALRDAALRDLKPETETEAADQVVVPDPRFDGAASRVAAQDSAPEATTVKPESEAAPPTEVARQTEEPASVAAAASPATTSPIIPQRGVVSSGWYAQVAAPRLSGDAESLATKLRGSGFPVAIENADVRGERYYRVLVGPEESRTHAERLLGQLRRETYLDGSAFIKFVR